MKWGLGYLIILLVLSSCATIFSKKTYNLSVFSKDRNARIIYKDTTYPLPTKIRVTRSKADLPLIFTTDSISRPVVVKARPDGRFVGGNLVWLYFAPIAYAVDLTSIKRFGYGGALMLNTRDTTTIFRHPIANRRFRESWKIKKGDVHWQLGYQILSNYQFQPSGEEMKTSGGCMGFRLGLSYAYKDGHFVCLTGGAAVDTYMPFTIIDFDGLYEIMSSSYIAVTDNFQWKRFRLGYGPAFARNTWDLRYSSKFDPTPPTRQPETKRSHSLGILLAGSYQLNRTLHLGICYRPTFLQISPDTRWSYEHMLSLEFGLGRRAYRKK